MNLFLSAAQQKQTKEIKSFMFTVHSESTEAFQRAETPQQSDLVAKDWSKIRQRSCRWILTYCAKRPERQEPVFRTSPVSTMRILPFLKDVLLALEVFLLIAHPAIITKAEHATFEPHFLPTFTSSFDINTTKYHLTMNSDTHRPPVILRDPTVDSVFFVASSPSPSPSLKLKTSLSTSIHSPSKLGFSNTKAWMRQRGHSWRWDPVADPKFISMCMSKPVAMTTFVGQ